MDKNPNLLGSVWFGTVWKLIYTEGFFLYCGFCYLLEMLLPQHSRINLAELKARIVKKLGPYRAKQYFHNLDRFLSLQISNVEFNKLCRSVLGRENIPLHNHFIRSILKNATTAKHPPPNHAQDVIKSRNVLGNKETLTDGYVPNGFHSKAVHCSSPKGLANGDILPLSPKKARTVHRGRKSGDPRTVSGANGKTNMVSQHLSCKDSNFISENRLSILHDVQEPKQHPQEPASAQILSRFSPISPDCPVSVPIKDQIKVSVGGNGKIMHARNQLQAPLGVPFCSASVGGACRATRIANTEKCVSTLNSGFLLDVTTLKERMDQTASSQGLEGVSMDCANLLNNGLDAYLKRLISSCKDLVTARSNHESIKNTKQQIISKLVNGIRPSEIMAEHRSHSLVSLQDFRVSMELNPKQLGVDWPLLLERICTRAYEE